MVNEAKWRRVIRCVREIIADKSLQPGDELPTYRELMEICDASEATVARAIGRMQNCRHRPWGAWEAAVCGTPAAQ